MEVTIRPLEADRWPEAGRLLGRAFWTEDYMRPLGEEPIALFVTVQDVYLAMDITEPRSVVLGAFAGDHVIGVVSLRRPGSCYFCAMDPDAGPDGDDDTTKVFHGVELTIRRLHVGLPRHWYVGPVGVEPTLQGHGVGRRLMDAAWERAMEESRVTVSVDCDPRLEAYYTSLGYRRIAVATDPWGFDIVGLRRDPHDEP
jgi:ribosomal protein S18 acetylase RimI-like enzyme